MYLLLSLYRLCVRLCVCVCVREREREMGGGGGGRKGGREQQHDVHSYLHVTGGFLASSCIQQSRQLALLTPCDYMIVYDVLQMITPVLRWKFRRVLYTPATSMPTIYT